ncbi:MAG: hypothetical protein ACRYFX_28700 [Janthinobacterium lividum]
MHRFLNFLPPLALLTTSLAAQTAPRSDSARVVVLPDVAVSDQIARLVVQSGKRTGGYHYTGPGGTDAVRFTAPRAGYHALRGIRVNLFMPGSIKQGSLRVRLASVGADGSPAEDNLLPAPVLLTTAALQQAHKYMTLTWPTNRVAVPEAGFFIVLESVGNFPDEYISKDLTLTRTDRKVLVEISRRNAPGTAPRLADYTDFVRLMGATPATTQAESWTRDTVTRRWYS